VSGDRQIGGDDEVPHTQPPACERAGDQDRLELRAAGDPVVVQRTRKGREDDDVGAPRGDPGPPHVAAGADAGITRRGRATLAAMTALSRLSGNGRLRVRSAVHKARRRLLCPEPPEFRKVAAEVLMTGVIEGWRFR